MRVIVTGATGLVGSGVIRECIANDQITEVLALTRKALPMDLETNPKVTVVYHEDFSTYSHSLVEKLGGAQACIWTIGGRSTQFSNPEVFKRVSLDYTVAAANAFQAYLAFQLPVGKKFRFIFCSGKAAEWDQQKSLIYLQDTRRMKGLVEKELCKIADSHNNNFEVFSVRPMVVLPTDASSITKISGKMYGAINVTQLSTAMVTIALDGYKDRIIEDDLATLGMKHNDCRWAT